MRYRAIPSGSCAARSRFRRQAITRGDHGPSVPGPSRRGPYSLPFEWSTKSRGKPMAVPRIWGALVKQRHGIGEHRVARLMRGAGIRAKTVKKGRATTQSQHRFPVAANTLGRAITVEAPNRVWAGDLTYVWTLEGWLYLAVLLDLYSRWVVGWAMGQRLTVELA